MEIKQIKAFYIHLKLSAFKLFSFLFAADFQIETRSTFFSSLTFDNNRLFIRRIENKKNFFVLIK